MSVPEPRAIAIHRLTAQKRHTFANGFIAPARGVMRASIAAPLSQFAETLRSVRISTDLFIEERRSTDRPLKAPDRGARAAGLSPGGTDAM